MSYLFKSTVSAWLEQALGDDNELGLTTLAIDGTVFRCQDSQENAREFGFIAKTHKPYPQLRLVSLISTETRMVLGTAFDGCQVREVTFAQRLAQEASDNSLTQFDRCYFSADLLLNWQSTGVQRHWLTPVKSKMRYEVVEEFTNNDLLIDIPVSPPVRKKNPELPETLRARFIAYQEPKGEIKGLVTSLVDPVKYPVDKLLNIYW